MDESNTASVVIGNWCRILRRPDAGLADHFFDLGGTSLNAIAFASALNEALGMGIDARFVFAHPTLEAFLSAAAALPRDRGAHHDAQPPHAGSWPLLPSHAWFFGKAFADPERFCFGLIFRVPRAALLDVLRRAITTVVDHHDALRTQFRQGPRGWEQMAVDDDVEIAHYELGALDADAQRDRIREIGAAMAGVLTFGTGFLARFATLDLGPDRGLRLLVVSHHLLADQYSWRILIQDIETAYRWGLAGRDRDRRPLPRMSGMREWAAFLNSTEVARQAVRDAEYWQTPRPPLHLPKEAPDGDGGQDEIRRPLNGLVASAIVDAARRRRMNPDVMLLAAFVDVVADWCATDHVSIDVISDGRTPTPRGMNLSRTVGWLTLQAPLFVDLPADHALSSVLRRVVGALDSRPAALGYSTLRFGSAAAAPRPVSQPFDGQVGFNYLGTSAARGKGSFFGRADEDANVQRHHPPLRPLELLCAIASTQVLVEWAFDAGVIARSTIDRLAARFEHNVLALAADSQH